MRARPASAWCIRNCPPCATCRWRRTSISASSRSIAFGLIDWRAMRRERRRTSAKPRHRRRSAHADGCIAARTAAARGAGARAVLRRAHHHPGRADLGAIAAGGRAAVRPAAPPARGRPQHRVHLALPRRRAGDLRPRDGIPQRPDGRDRGLRRRRQALDHRPHDRRRTRRAGGELPRRHPAAQPAGCEGRAGD